MEGQDKSSELIVHSLWWLDAFSVAAVPKHMKKGKQGQQNKSEKHKECDQEKNLPVLWPSALYLYKKNASIALH